MRCHYVIQKYWILDTYYSDITNCFHLKQLSHSDISLRSSYVSSYLHMPSTIVFIMFRTEWIVGVTQGKVMRSTCGELFARNTKKLLNMFTMSSTRVQKCAGKCSVPSFCRLFAAAAAAGRSKATCADSVDNLRSEQEVKHYGKLHVLVLPGKMLYDHDPPTTRPYSWFNGGRGK